MKNLYLLAISVVFCGLALAQPERGVWFWNNTSIPDPAGGPDPVPSPYGSGFVVGDSAAEDETIAFWKLHDVKRVYGSYQNRPVTEPAVIAAWNRKLHGCRIQSQLLLDGINVHLPSFIPDLLNKIDERFIDYNDAYAGDLAAQFKAVHLDVEPQGAWGGASPLYKRVRIADLLTVYTAVRDHLDTNGYAHIPLYADIPFTWDKIPGSIGWADPADRDGWFADIAAVLDGVSIMTFSKDTAPELMIATDYERSGPLSNRARIGIQPKVFGSGIWPDYSTFRTEMLALEAAVGSKEATDIENYAFWRHALATTTPDVAPIYRGLYFHRDPDIPGAIGDTFGTIHVVGNAARESEMLDWLQTFGIRRLFGEYGNFPRDEPEKMAAWNAQLATACIESQLYLRAKDVQSETFISDVTTYLTANLINYNNEYADSPDAQFKSLRLDFVPHQQTSWPTLTPTQRRALLYDQRDAYLAVKDHLEAAGFGDFPLHADIIPELDDMDFIGWPDDAARAGWYASVLGVVDSITIKTTAITAPEIEAQMAYERSVIPPCRVRLGMYSHTTANPWPDLETFEDMLLHWEGLNSTATSLAADIDSYAAWRHSITAGGNVHHTYIEEFADGVDIAKPPSGGGIVIVFDGEYGYTYSIRSATDPGKCRQGEILASHTQSSLPHRQIRMTLPKSGDKRFYIVERRLNSRQR